MCSDGDLRMSTLDDLSVDSSNKQGISTLDDASVDLYGNFCDMAS